MPPVQHARLSMYLRERIVVLRRTNSIDNIRLILLESENVQVSNNAICSFLVSYRRTGSLLDPPRRRNDDRKKLQPEHIRFIDQTIESDNEISAEDIATKLHQQFGLTVSSSTVKRARADLGWMRSPVQYCQLMRDANKPKRLDFALRCIENQETFDDAIFTDETTVKIQNTTKYGFRRRGEPAPLKAKAKHPYQVHVWGGISRRGATGLFLFTCTMDSLFYQRILRTKFIPFVNLVFPDSHRLVQDNDPKHVSRSTKAFMDENKINHWPTPPESPDLNPIEMIWSQLKYYIRRRKKPRTQQELIDGIREYWATLTPEICGRYIDHLYKVIPAVVEKNGAASGH